MRLGAAAVPVRTTAGGSACRAVGVALIVIVVLIVHERRDLALWSSGAWSAADNIAEASSELTKLDPDARRAQVDAYRTQRRLVENARPPRPPHPHKETLRIQQAFAEKVRTQLGPDYGILDHQCARPLARCHSRIGHDAQPPEGRPPPEGRSAELSLSR